MREGFVLGLYLDNLHTHYQDIDEPELILNAINFVRQTINNAINSDEASDVLHDFAYRSDSDSVKAILRTSVRIIEYVDC